MARSKKMTQEPGIPRRSDQSRRPKARETTAEAESGWESEGPVVAMNRENE